MAALVSREPNEVSFRFLTEEAGCKKETSLGSRDTNAATLVSSNLCSKSSAYSHLMHRAKRWPRCLCGHLHSAFR